MYKNLEVITEETRKLKVSSTQNYSFAKELTQLPIALYEMFNASRSYPILFSKDANGIYSAVAILSIEKNKNKFIDSAGNYTKGEYIPTYINRYPFIYVNSNDTMVLAYDNEKDYISEDLDISLYDENAEHSIYFKEKINQLNTFQVSIQDISTVIAILDKAGVIDILTKPVTIGNNKINLNGFLYVNEKKIYDLKDKQLNKLVKSGAYKIAIAQLISMNNFDKLVVN